MDEAIADVYTSVLHTQLKQYAVWPPGMPIKLGDFGILKGAIFDKKGEIEKDQNGFHISIRPVVSSTPIKFEYKSAGTKETRGELGVNIGPGVTGGIPINVKANLQIDFSSENSIYFKAFNCIYHGIENISDVQKEILDLFEREMWDGNLVVVTNLFLASSTTVIISEKSGGMIDIRAKSDANDFIDLADVNAELRSASEQDIGMSILAKSGYTPLFGLSKVRMKRWWERLLGRPPSVDNIFTVYAMETDFQGVSAELLLNAREDVSLKGVDMTDKSINDIFEFVEMR